MQLISVLFNYGTDKRIDDIIAYFNKFEIFYKQTFLDNILQRHLFVQLARTTFNVTFAS